MILVDSALSNTFLNLNKCTICAFFLYQGIHRITNFDMRRIYFCSFLSSLPYLKRVSCNRIATLRVLIWKTEFFLGIHSHLHFDNENHEEKKKLRNYISLLKFHIKDRISPAFGQTIICNVNI